MSDRRPGGLYIIGGAEEGTFSAVDPELIKAAAPVWQDDIYRFGPWLRVEDPGLPAELLPLWRAEAYRGASTVFIAGHCRSTMDTARELIRLGILPPWGSVLAVEQSAGRGQKQRRCISPPGNIYGSWFWPRIDAVPQQPGASWRPLASLLAGSVMASGLEDLGVSVRIKWPNDLIAGNRKFGGLLVEDKGGNLIVGAGINLVSAPEDQFLRDDFVLSATRLQEALPSTGPLQLWLHLVDSGRRRLEDLTACLIPEEFVGLLERRMAWLGKKVLVKKGNKAPFEAVFTGLAEDGGLRIARGTAVETLYTGSLLPLK